VVRRAVQEQTRVSDPACRSASDQSMTNPVTGVQKDASIRRRERFAGWEPAATEIITNRERKPPAMIGQRIQGSFLERLACKLRPQGGTTF
jgi:hypothetical protein